MIGKPALLSIVLLTSGAAPVHSGYQDASAPVRAMQDDDAANPGFLWVQQGESLWADAAIPSGRSCASCHGPVSAMQGVSARYPMFDARVGRPVTLEQRIDDCRTRRQGAASWPAESDELLSITALVGRQSRGMPIAIDTSGPGAPFAAHGRSIFTTRMGQLNLSCAQCHDSLAGQRLAGALIPQGEPNGYPLYRLEWQSLGSLYRRLRNCLTGVRAEPFAPNSPDLVDLEFFLASRANGLPVETPAVRP